MPGENNECCADTVVGYAHGVEESLEKFGFYTSETKGTSMEPLFRTHRDTVLIVRPEGELKKYDAALYTGGSGKYILHRVIAVRPDCYIIRGDNTFVREYVPKNMVIGVLSGFCRKGKNHSVDERGYRVYVRVWNFIYPIRACFNFARRAAAKVYRTLFRRKK